MYIMYVCMCIYIYIYIYLYICSPSRPSFRVSPTYIVEAVLSGGDVD